MEWSQHDAMVIAVAWQHGGLSVWSVFGVLLYYSHGDQPGYEHNYVYVLGIDVVCMYE